MPSISQTREARVRHRRLDLLDAQTTSDSGHATPEPASTTTNHGQDSRGTGARQVPCGMPRDAFTPPRRTENARDCGSTRQTRSAPLGHYRSPATFQKKVAAASLVGISPVSWLWDKSSTTSRDSPPSVFGIAPVSSPTNAPGRHVIGRHEPPGSPPGPISVCHYGAPHDRSLHTATIYGSIPKPPIHTALGRRAIRPHCVLPRSPPPPEGLDLSSSYVSKPLLRADRVGTAATTTARNGPQAPSAQEEGAPLRALSGGPCSSDVTRTC